ncbi:hypothetical protein [Litorisediminicola beolgyonensis]|uniref:Lipoprotein n=1 Tax=Litorisediminicola beolgyonensis TaxID=1173614 RepID=A0ABW3ZJV2_9RHOB
MEDTGAGQDDGERNMMRRRRAIALMVAFAALGACATPPEATRSDVGALADAIAALGPEVDPREAQRAAEIAFAYPRALAREWQVTDAPLVHNAKVLHGLREKGLCNDWTEAMLARLRQEDFRTLSLHWASSPPKGFRVVHHSAVISAAGASMRDGIVLDPWRGGGQLFWARPDDDTRYDWGPPL